MVTISGLGSGPGGVGQVARTTRKPASGSFSVASEPAADQDVAETNATTATAPLSLMLSLQEELPSDAERDQAALRHGGAVMEALSALQRALLGGEVDPEVLRRLVALAESAPEPADPRLAGVMEALLLRAKVEIARRVMSKS